MNKLFVHVRLPYFGNAYKDATQYELTFRDMQKLLKQMKKEKIDSQIVFILNHMWEMTTVKELNFLHDFFKKRLERYNVSLFILYSVCIDKTVSLPKNVVEYNFFQNKTVHATTAGDQQTSTNWNKSKFRGLLLTGKAHKFQRLIPIKRLLDNNLLNESDMEWSFFYNKRYAQDIKSILNINDDQLQSFVLAVSRNPDNIEISHYGSMFGYDGFPYSHRLYADTSWSLISETHLGVSAFWITEKTYRVIMNKHPFIFFGQPGCEEYLRSQGFRTFEYCFPYDYDTISSNEERLDTAFKNVCYVKENWKKLDFNRINEDVNYNYTVLCNNVVKEQKHLIEKLKFKDGDKICDLIYYNRDGAEAPTVEDIVNGRKNIIYYYWDIK